MSKIIQIEVIDSSDVVFALDDSGHVWQVSYDLHLKREVWRLKANTEPEEGKEVKQLHREEPEKPKEGE
jgi:hypothetical protein